MKHRTRGTLGITAVGFAMSTALGVACSSADPHAAAVPLGTSASRLTPCDYSVTTGHNDNQRTGAQTCETVFTPQTVPYTQEVAQRILDKDVLGQPLVLHGQPVAGKAVQDALVVVTLGGSLYVLNPTTLAFLPGVGPIQPLPSGVNPGLGVTSAILSTPVIDKTSDVLYLVTNVTTGGTQTFYLLAFDLKAMSVVASTPIQGTCVSGEAFTASPHRQRAGLLLDHGYLYAGFGYGSGSEENGPYNGWVFAFTSVASGLAPVGQPYCVTRAPTLKSATGMGRGGIWQMGAGLAADTAGNVYASTGNAPSYSASDANDDGDSYVQLPSGANWTGLPKGKYADPVTTEFQAQNDLDTGSDGPIVLPGPATRLLGGGKFGKFYVLDGNMSLVQDDFRGAYNQYFPILGDPANLESDSHVVACDKAYCDTGLPSATGTTPCCPTGCSPFTSYPLRGGVSLNGTQQACYDFVHGSYPHVHGDPSYLNGMIYWWPEKDWPRFMTWNAETGSAGGVVDGVNRISTTVADRAPSPTSSDPMKSGMPGGLTSISANGTSNAVLWSTIPSDGGNQGELLKAFDVSGTLPKASLLSALVGADGVWMSHSYPTIANGYVYVTNHDPSNNDGVAPRFPQLVAYSTRPQAPTWVQMPGCTTAIASGWAGGSGALYRYVAQPDLSWPPQPSKQVKAGDWNLVPFDNAAPSALSVDLNGTPWVIDGGQSVYKGLSSSSGYSWASFPGARALSVASGSTDTETWIVGSNNLVYNWNGSAWVAVTSPLATKVAVFSAVDPSCNRHLPVILGTDGSIYHDSCTGSFTANGRGFDLTTDFAIGTEGDLWVWAPMRAGWLDLGTTPWGTSTRIGSGPSGLYASGLSAGCTVQKFTQPMWTDLPGNTSYLASGWAVGTPSQGIFQWVPSINNWSQAPFPSTPDAPPIAISVDLNGVPWVVDKQGTIFKQNGATWNTYTGANAVSVASGSNETETWAVRPDGSVANYNGAGVWNTVAAPKTQKIAVFSGADPVCGDHVPVILAADGRIYPFKHNAGSCWTTASPNGGFPTANGAGVDIATDFAVGTEGDLWVWSPPWNPNAGWVDYAPTTWGTATRIGAWANGIYATSPNHWGVQRIMWR